jgi:hypothetical protein
VIKNVLLLTCCLLLSAYETTAQNAPVTTAPSKTACPGTTVSIPVTVTGFNNIGSVSLRLDYNPAVLSYASSSNTSGFPGLIIGGGTAGKVIAGGFNSVPNGISYADNTVLFTVTFNYLGGTTALTWFDNGASCEYGGPTPNYTTLNDLPYASYYNIGQVAPVLGVDFTADSLLPMVNQPVMLSDLTTGGPTAWNWTITPGTYTFLNGTSSVSQNPQVKFTLNGPYNISLAATKGTCTITKSKPNFIHCGTKGLWTGITSADWNVQSNWHNYMVPESTIDVVIPASSANWPVCTGDLVIGSQCRSLRLEGSTSLMTITGNLVVNSGK